MSAAQLPAVISISSHVARGSVGNRAAIFALESFGFPAWSVPTVILPYHPGHGRATRIETDAGEFEKLLNDLLASPWIGEVKAVMTGYMASAGQVGAVGRFVRTLTVRQPDLVYLCDPVIGDRNGLYVSPVIAEAIRDELLPPATVATPNIHELAWLTGTAATDSIERVRQACSSLAGGMRFPEDAIVVATSAPGMMCGNIANLLVRGQRVVLAENRQLAGPGNGAGDLFAAVFLAGLLGGHSPEKALERAAASVFEVMAEAVRRGDAELMPQLAGPSLVRPMAMVTMRSVAAAKGAGS